MKFIHCADLHLDSKMETNLTTAQARERKKEILFTFEKMIDYAKSNNVRGIIIAGDMFDTSRISNTTKTRIINNIRKNPSVDFLYLSGNHDESNFISQIEELPENLKLFNDKWTSYDYENVSITGTILTPSNSSSIYDTLKLDSSRLNILVLHGQTSKYDSKEKSEIVNLVKLKNRNIDYLALGHIHRFIQEPLDKRGTCCYSGCLEGRGFDECGEKGFVLLETHDNIITSKFIPFAMRQLLEKEFDITKYNDWFEIEENVLKEVNNISSENLLKVILVGKYNIKLEKQLPLLDKKLNDKFYFAKIKDNSSLEINPKDFENDISLRGEFIKQVMNSDLTDEEKESIVVVGLKALNGEDLK